MFRGWRRSGLWWRVLSATVLLLSACAAPPTGPDPSMPHLAPPRSGPAKRSTDQASTATDAASMVLLRHAVDQHLAEITPDEGGQRDGFHAVRSAGGLGLRFGLNG